MGLCTADVNGDGVLYIIAVSRQSSPGFSVLLSDNNGTFGAPAFKSLAGTPMQCVARDFNGDGCMDVAITIRADNRLNVFPGTASCTFASPTSFVTGTTPYEVRVAHMNQDTYLNLVVTDAVFMGLNGLHISQNNGASFSNDQLSPALTTSYGALTTNLVMTDLNNDGKADIVTVSSDNLLNIRR